MDEILIKDEDLVLSAAAERAEQGNRMVSSTQQAIRRTLFLTKSQVVGTTNSSLMSAANVDSIAEIPASRIL